MPVTERLVAYDSGRRGQGKKREAFNSQYFIALQQVSAFNETFCSVFFFPSSSTFITCYQEYIRTRVGNSILWGLPRQNSKFVIDDAQPLSFQVVMHSTLNTCMLALSRSSIFLTGISG